MMAAIIVPDQSPILGDAIAYREAGKSLWANGQLNALYFMPLYPALVAISDRDGPNCSLISLCRPRWSG